MFSSSILSSDKILKVYLLVLVLVQWPSIHYPRLQMTVEKKSQKALRKELVLKQEHGQTKEQEQLKEHKLKLELEHAKEHRIAAEKKKTQRALRRECEILKQKQKQIKEQKRTEEHQLAVWLDEQLKNYKHRTGDLADPEKHILFTDFLKKYHHVFSDDDFDLLGMTQEEVMNL